VACVIEVCGDRGLCDCGCVIAVVCDFGLCAIAVCVIYIYAYIIKIGDGALFVVC
jgi:hypothetical protein